MTLEKFWELLNAAIDSSETGTFPLDSFVVVKRNNRTIDSIDYIDSILDIYAIDGCIVIETVAEEE